MKDRVQSTQFVPPSRLARVMSWVAYLILVPPERLLGRCWKPLAEKQTLLSRIAFWVLCESWYRFERAAGRL